MLADRPMLLPAAVTATVDRRSLLKGAATVLVAFSLPRLGPGPARADVAGTTAFDAFIAIGPEGASLTLPHVEMGQGVQTAVAMLVAEEMDLPLDRVAVVQAPADETLYANPAFGIQATGGSTSIRAGYLPMRQAGADARAKLLRAAAVLWNADPASLSTRDGAVHHPDGRRAPYADLAASASVIDLPEPAPLKSAEAFTLIGRPQRRIEGADKGSGRARYGIDARPAGLSFAALLLCPHVGGRLVSVDGTAALAVRGVRQVVPLADGIAVVADHTGAALKGIAALAPVWDPGASATLTTAALHEAARQALGRKGVRAGATGDADRILSAATRHVEAVYEMPLLAHAAMEPLNCTAHVTADRCEVWVGTQIAGRARAIAAAESGLPPEKVVIHNYLLGGGFGRRLEVDFIGRAVAVARAVDGPVQVVWPREADLRDRHFRPIYVSGLAAALGADGNPTAIRHTVVGPSIVARWIPPGFRDGIDPDIVEAALGPYDWSASAVDYVREELPEGLVAAWWRGVGVTRNAFMVECFMDELAAAAGKDPLAFRLDRLAGSPRAAAVLREAAVQAGWGGTLPAGEGLGLALLHGFGSYVAEVAHVTVAGDGTVRVKRVVAAVDCGQPVDPGTIRAQVEGGIVFGLSAALHGEITIADGVVEQTNFDGYPVLRIDETPVIETHILENREAPGGMGEPATAAIAPAVVNAIHAATGRRLRRLPVGRIGSA